VSADNCPTCNPVISLIRPLVLRWVQKVQTLALIFDIEACFRNAAKNMKFKTNLVSIDDYSVVAKFRVAWPIHL